MTAGAQSVAICERVHVGEDTNGTCQVLSGSLTVSSQLVLSRHRGARGTLSVTGGELTATNLTTILGNEGPADIFVSGGLVRLRGLQISPPVLEGGTNPAALHLSGGTLLLSSNLTVGTESSTTGTVNVTGGQLFAPNHAIRVGRLGVGQLNVFNGHVQAAELSVAGFNSNRVSVATLSGGLLDVGTLVLTNAHGRFVFLGGSLYAQNTLVTGPQFVVGDGNARGTAELAATLHLGGGTHTFSNGLRISHYAMLMDAGTVQGDIINYGTIRNDQSGATLSFGGVVTNYGAVVVSNNATVQFSGRVFNEGVIDASQGNLICEQCEGPGQILTGGPIAVSPPTLDFGAVSAGATTQMSFTVTNLGSKVVSDCQVTIGGGPFALVSSPSFNLPAFGSAPVTIAFSPATLGAFNSTVIFTSSGGNSTNSVMGTGATLTAAFSATPTNGYAPLTVTFTDLSTGTITNRLWSFGDGGATNTTATAVSHLYSYPPGDVNRDRLVNGSDSLLINQVQVGLRLTNATLFQTNVTVRLIVQGPGGASTNERPGLIQLGTYPNGDVNATTTVTGGDSLLINQVQVGLRSFVVTQFVHGSRSDTNSPTPVTIYGIGFRTNEVTGAQIGPLVNLPLSNVVAVSRERITAIVPAGGATGTGVVQVIATTTNGVTSFGRFINE
jgi:T5SS/PEP-CTERM-associated repeat protein